MLLTLLNLVNFMVHVPPPAVDVGFSRLFKSNLAEYSDVPVTFTSPLPAWMNGTLVRNGMGQFENGARSFVHSFDGFAKLASWKFQGNQSTALFSTKFLRTEFYNESMEQNTIAPYLLFMASKPPFNFLERLQALSNGIDNMNINVYKFPNQGATNPPDFAALSDFWVSYKIDINDLSTMEGVRPMMVDATGTTGSSGFMDLLSSAHPLPEPGSSNILTYLSSVSMVPWNNSYMKLVRSTSLHSREVVAKWPIAEVPYMHSFSVSATKAILLASPFYTDVTCMALRAEPFSCLDWFPDKNATFYVVDLQSGNVTHLSTSCLFAMHHANAYEENDKSIIIDLSTHTDPHLVGDLTLDILRNASKRNAITARPKLRRFRLDLETSSVTELAIDLGAPSMMTYLDFPVINEQYRSKHYCWLYGVVPKANNKTFSDAAVVKKDLCNLGAGDRSWNITNHYPGEAWFVPRPGGHAEDDGVILVPVLDGPRGVSYLAILDAKTMTLINQADTPTYIPYNLHGRYFEQ